MKVSDLEKCVSILARHALLFGIDEVTTKDVDLYWTITSSQWTRIYEDPTPAVGSFIDDAAELERMLADPARASAVDLERVAHLLLLLSDQLCSDSSAER
jgi:hypothetical protein